MFTMQIDVDKIAIFIGTISTGGLGTIIVGYLKYRTSREKREEQEAVREATLIKALNDQSTLNETLFTKMLSTLQGMDHTLALGFKNKVRDSHQEIMELKRLAHNKQQDDLYNGLKRIIRANGLTERDDRLKDIRDLLTTAIRDTDDTLYKFNLCGYIADTDQKIDFVCSSEAPEVLYRIITNETNKVNHQKLEDNIRKYARIVLNSVKGEFYDSDGKVKK